MICEWELLVVDASNKFLGFLFIAFSYWLALWKLQLAIKIGSLIEGYFECIDYVWFDLLLIDWDKFELAAWNVIPALYTCFICNFTCQFDNFEGSNSIKNELSSYACQYFFKSFQSKKIHILKEFCPCVSPSSKYFMYS